MVAPSPAARRRSVWAGLLGLCVCWAVFSALPSLAAATPYEKPTTPVTEPSFAESLSGAYERCWKQVTEKAFAIPAEGSTTQWWTYSTARSVAQACEEQMRSAAGMAERLWWVTAELLHEQESTAAVKEKVEALSGQLAELHADLSTSGALYGETKLVAEELGKEGQLHSDLTGAGVVIASLPELEEGENELGTVTVANPPNVAEVTAAVNSDTETFNASTWAIFGMVVGFGALVFVWKLVRP